MSDTVRWTAAAMLLSLLAGCGSLPGPAPVPDAAPLTWDRELPEGVRIDFRNEESAWWIPVRVLDADTLLPVPGARVDNWWEADWPGAEPWADCLAQSGVTDEDGYVLVRNKVEYGNWFYIEAPGYAPLGEMSFEDEWRIGRGEDYAIEVRDWLDRPIAGAVVEYLLGCGHTANARVETTGEDGRAVLRCIDPYGDGSIWLRAEGIEGRSEAYGSIDGLPVEDGVHVVRGAWGPAVSGVLLRRDGTPVPGAFVGTRSSHRGPWTTTGPDGSFRLLGAPPWETLTVDAPPPPDATEGAAWEQFRFDSIPGGYQVVRLDDPGDPASGAPEPGTVPLRVSVRASGLILPVGRLRVLAVRTSDGRSVEKWPLILDDEGGDGVSVKVELPVPPGEWTVTVGTPAGLLSPDRDTVVVGDGGGEVSFWTVENPVLRPVVAERGEDGTLRQVEDVDSGKFLVLTGEGADVPTPALDREGVLHVPEEAPFQLEYDAGRGRRARVRVAGGGRGGDPVLELPPPREWVEPPEPESPRPGSFPEARLTVFYPDGTPACAAGVSIRGTTASGTPFEDGFELEGDGTAEYAFHPGDRVEVEVPYLDGRIRDDTLPVLRAVIAGPGPWTLRWPSTEITLRVEDPAGNPVEEFTWFPGGYENHWVDGDTLVLRGAPTGPLRFWVHAEGWRARDIRLAVTAGEKRTVVIRLETPEPEDDLPEIPAPEER